MTDPIVGKAEDFTVEIMTELGATMRQSSLSHVGIDDDHLRQEAVELPQLLYYYNAVHTRLALREAQSEIKLEEAEANALIKLRAQANACGEKIGVEDLKAHVRLDPLVQQLRREVVELRGRKDTLRGVLDALRQKGYSLQLAASIRSREEDWLRNSFSDRFKDHPQRDQIAKALNQILGVNFGT